MVEEIVFRREVYDPVVGQFRPELDTIRGGVSYKGISNAGAPNLVLLTVPAGMEFRMTGFEMSNLGILGNGSIYRNARLTANLIRSRTLTLARELGDAASESGIIGETFVAGETVIVDAGSVLGVFFSVSGFLVPA